MLAVSGREVRACLDGVEGGDFLAIVLFSLLKELHDSYRMGAQKRLYYPF
jgi:hypothetical protein